MRHFFASVAGESFLNHDGTDRQAIISGCRLGEPLILDPEPDNPHDANAIRVLRDDGKQIGYVERGLAAQLSAEGVSHYHAFVAGIGQRRRYNGVSLLLVVNTDRLGADAVAAYAVDVLLREATLASRGSRRGRRRTTTEGVATSSIVGPIITGVLVALGIIAALLIAAEILWN